MPVFNNRCLLTQKEKPLIIFLILLRSWIIQPFLLHCMNTSPNFEWKYQINMIFEIYPWYSQNGNLQLRNGWENGWQDFCWKFGGSSSSEFQNCSDLYQLNFHRHVDGTEYFNGMGLSKNSRILSRETRSRISGE